MQETKGKAGRPPTWEAFLRASLLRNHRRPSRTMRPIPCHPWGRNVHKSLNGLSGFVLATVAAAGFVTSTGAAGNGRFDPDGIRVDERSEGSLRAALEAVAKQEGPAQILIGTNDDIEIDSTLVYARQGAVCHLWQGAGGRARDRAIR